MAQMKIDTRNSGPKRQPPEGFLLLRDKSSMQDQGVVHPSSSPWASLVVLVHKKDGSLRFCIDNCNLNSVMKSDTFPLTHVDNMLDQLGKYKFFFTLDLALGYWQVQVHPGSQKKILIRTCMSFLLCHLG